MPTITKQKLAAAIKALPFAPGRDVSKPPAFEALPEALQRAIAESIARDKAAGMSGNDLRAKYSGASEAHAKGQGLTGPMRRQVLRKFGFDNAKTIARSYDAYTDGEARKGSAHAKEHGALAAQRQAEALAAVEAQAKAAKAQAAKPARKPRAARTTTKKAR